MSMSVYLYVFMDVHMWAGTKKVSGSPGTGVTGGCEPPIMGASNVLKCWAISPAHDLKI